MKDYKDNDFRKQIINAVNEDKLIIFTGAGVSRLCGLPSWDQAANDLLDYCVKNVQNDFLYKDKERIVSNINDAREKITIGYYLLSKVDETGKFFYSWLKDEFALKKIERNEEYKNKAKKIRQLIRSLSKIVVTTNVDLILDEGLNDADKFYRNKDIENILIKENNYQNQIWHIHGSLDRVSEVVFTTQQYLKRYTNDDFKESLNALLTDGEYTILFIGYGFSELQLLDFLVNAKNNNSIKRLFLLQPYFSTDSSLYEAEAPYYEDYGIQLIQYPKDTGYDFLFNVLEDLKKEFDKCTIVSTKRYINVQNVLKKKCNKTNKNEIIVELNNLDDLSKSKSIKNLVMKSKYASQWLNFLISHTDFSRLFEVDNDIQNDNENDNESLNIKNIRYFLDEFTKHNNNNLLYEKSRIIVKKLFARFQSDNMLYNNMSLVFSLLKAIFSDFRLINIREFIDFLKGINKNSSTNISWIMFLNNDINKNFLKAYKNCQLNILKLVINDILSLDLVNNYNYKRFFELYGNELAKKHSKEVFNMCFNKLKKEINSSPLSHYNISGECFDVYKNDSKYFLPNKEDYIIKLQLSALEYIDLEKLSQLFYTNIKSKSKFEKRLAIYMCNLRFLDLRDNFFNFLPELDGKSNYSEIYSLIINNKNNFKTSEIQKIVKFISSSTFYDDNNFMNIVCKIDLCNIFIDSNINEEIFTELKKYYLSKLEGHFEQESLKNTIAPLDRSKMGFVTIKNKQNRENNIKNVQNYSREKIIELITTESNDKEKNIIINSFTEFYKKFNFKSLSINELLKTSDQFISYFINSFAIDETVTFNEELSLLRDFINNFTSYDNIHFVYDYIKEIYFTFESKKKDNANRHKMLDLLFGLKCIKEEKEWKCINSSLNNHTYQDVYSANIFFVMSLIIKLSNDNKDLDNVKEILENNLLKDKCKIVSKGIIAFNLSILLKKDYSWTKEKIKVVFDNVFEGYNYSYAIYSIASPYDIKLIELIDKKDILKSLLDSKEFEDYAYNYSTFILRNCILNNSINHVEETILKTKNIKFTLNELIERSTMNFLKKYQNEFMLILEKASKLINEECTILVVNLIKLCPKDANFKNKIFPYIEDFSKKGFYADRICYIKEIFEKKGIKNSEKIQLITFISHSIKECSLYYEKIIDLFSTVNWNLYQDELNELIMNYRNIDVDLAAELYEKFKKNSKKVKCKN